MPVFTPFETAITETALVKRHLLLGNGFSIALFPNFRYDSLLEQADFRGMPEARRAFDALETSDFETVINAFRQTCSLLPHYTEDDELREKISGHADALKETLIASIAGKHPERPSDVTEEQYASCRQFLAHFVGEDRVAEKKNGCIYTLNYDLLLYWTSLHAREGEENSGEVNIQIKHNDGFVAPEDAEADYVTWDAEGAHNQNTHYLHGGLHLYDNGPDLHKICWERSGGIPLVDQIRSGLDEGNFPLFVSEGTSREKLHKIRHSGYLHRSLKSFTEICKSGASLFVFGFSFSENDQHIIEKIQKGKIKNLYISLYGAIDSPQNREIINKVELIAEQRSDRYPLNIQYLSSAEINVWGA